MTPDFEDRARLFREWAATDGVYLSPAALRLYAADFEAAARIVRGEVTGERQLPPGVTDLVPRISMARTQREMERRAGL